MFDCIIIGAGPASLSAAIYLKNANKNILIVEKNAPGGKLLKTSKINNYPGFALEDASILAYDMYEQTQKLQIPITIEKVINIKNNPSEKEVITDKNVYKTKTILIACGRVEKPLGIENEEELIGKGVSYCVKCDASLYKDKKVALVSNDIEDAIYLSNIASEVIFINSSYESKDCKKNNINIINNEKIKKINKEGEIIKSIILSNDEEYDVSCLFIQTGYTPNIDFINSLFIKTKDNYIEVDDDMQTNIKGIYAAGDIIRKNVYQVVTAVSDGAVAALSIIKQLK